MVSSDLTLRNHCGVRIELIHHIGSRVKMSAKKLKSQIFPAGASNTLVRAKIDNDLVGHVFGTTWEYDGHNIVWITQLCVVASQRRKGISKLLIEQLRNGERVMGILSSHPYAIMAFLRVSGHKPEQVDLQMTRDHGHAIMKSCPAPYVHNATLRGGLFEENAPPGVISCANTSFFVDHAEPVHALQTLEIARINWPFGTLPDGHEFALIIELNS